MRRDDPSKQQGAGLKALILCVTGALQLLGCQTVGDRSETHDSAELKLPAAFKGTLPCADCEGICYHFDLWPDGVFHLPQIYLGTLLVADDKGRWHTDPRREAILLYDARERKLQFEVKGSYKIRLLDQQGRPIESSLPYNLTSIVMIDKIEENQLDGQTPYDAVIKPPSAASDRSCFRFRQPCLDFRR